ncbi:hypothetical protein J437_LFUL010282, partial [Ladona fulva]
MEDYLVQSVAAELSIDHTAVLGLAEMGNDSTKSSGITVSDVINRLQQEKYRDKGTELQENQLELMSKQLEVFRSNLEDFAAKHRSEIKRNPQFRRQFQEMCASIGVDPLASRKDWEENRAKMAMEYLVKEGLAWIDLQSKPEKSYWFP